MEGLIQTGGVTKVLLRRYFIINNNIIPHKVYSLVEEKNIKVIITLPLNYLQLKSIHSPRLYRIIPNLIHFLISPQPENDLFSPF